MPISKVVANTTKVEVADPQDFKWLVTFRCAGPGKTDGSVIVNAPSESSADTKAVANLTKTGCSNVQILKVKPYLGLAASAEVADQQDFKWKVDYRDSKDKAAKFVIVDAPDESGAESIALWDITKSGIPDAQVLKIKPYTGLAASSRETSRIKTEEEYSWMIYTGAEIHAANDKGRNLILHKGDKYGARKSSNGKQIRLITEEGGPTKVFTCDAELAALLAKRSKPVKAK